MMCTDKTFITKTEILHKKKPVNFDFIMTLNEIKFNLMHIPFDLCTVVTLQTEDKLNRSVV